ncbi:MAG: lactate utilization protein [Eubacteriales bacterium]|nr:lactate utilization protein [Eubacteriales bacterium]
MNFDTVTSALQRNGYAVSCFETGREAAAYLNSVLDGRRIGCGGSATLQQLGLIDSLAEHNRLFTHTGKTGAEFEAMLSAELRDTDVYLTSANALAETGELVNIDGNGNRVASTLFGHQKVYFILGRNKIAPTLDAAIWRARNVAAPKNAQRLRRRTPCAVKADRCYDCNSPDRICKGLVVLWRAMGMSEMEVVLINEDLGF